VAAKRKLIWIEESRFRGFGCSACAWVFKTSGAPKGDSFDEMLQNFERQRDDEFTSHICVEHPQSQERKKVNH
jgi:hypothetical protein